MSGADFSFSISSGGGAPKAPRADKYIAPPFDAYIASESKALLLEKGSRSVEALPLELAQLLSQCSRLRTLDEHSEHIVKTLQLPGQQSGAVRQSLTQLADLGLLKTARDLYGELVQPITNADQASPAAIETLWIRTCDRPDSLKRLLESLAAQPLPADLKHCIVFDDSRQPDSRQATRRVISELQPRFGGRLQLIDRDRCHAVLEYLAAHSGARLQALSWYLEGDAGDEARSFGTGFNFALLASAGTGLTIMDDDMTIQLHQLSACRDQPAFVRMQHARLEFPPTDQALAGAPFPAVDGHPLELHARYLGKTAAQFATPGKNDPAGLFHDLDPQLWAELGTHNRALLTTSGTLGDPGTSNIHWVFAENADSLAPLCQSETQYRELLERRQVARCAVQPQASTAFALMTGGMTSIDNRQLLLPTQARGQAEDLLFGALISYLHPGALQINLPHMLVHSPPESRAWTDQDIAKPRTINRAGFLATQLEMLRPIAPETSIRSRIDLLGDFFSGLSRTSQSELQSRIRRELLSLRENTLQRVTATRNQLAAPPWLARDFEASIAAHGQYDSADERHVQQLAAALPDFLSSYASALPDWERAWQYCADTDLSELLERLP